MKKIKKKKLQKSNNYSYYEKKYEENNSGKEITLENYFDMPLGAESVLNKENSENPENKKMTSAYIYKKNKTLILQSAGFFLAVIVILTGILIYRLYLAEKLAEEYNNAMMSLNISGQVSRDNNTQQAIAAIRYDEDLYTELTKSGEPEQNSSDNNILSKYNMKYINQMEDGMPNGCEVVSLAMVMSRYLPDITSHEIAENYMPRSPMPEYSAVDKVYTAEDPAYYYIGDPAGRGYGIFAPGLTKTAQSTINAYGLDSLKAVDVSGCSDRELFRYIDDGYPVIVFTPSNMSPVSWGAIATWHIPSQNWKLFRWPSPLHCVVLLNYDYSENKVTICDPAAGVVDYDIALFLKRWGEMGPYQTDTRHAVVIIDTAA